MIIPIVGKPGSGKSTLMRYKILDNLKNGKSSIFINFEKGSNLFSTEFLKNTTVVNVNSFSQISKLKDINSQIIILNFSKIDFKNKKLYENLTKRIFKNIFENSFLNEHDIFIDNYDLIFFKMFNILYRRRNSIYIAVSDLINFSIRGIDFKNTYFLEHSMIGIFEQRDLNFLSKTNSHTLYFIRELENNKEYFSLDIRNLYIPENSFEKRILDISHHLESYTF